MATPETEQALRDVALAGAAAHVEQIVRTWRRVDRAAEAAEDAQRHASRSLATWVDEDGMVAVRGRLTPEVGAAVRRALEAALDAERRPAASAGAGGGALAARDGHCRFPGCQATRCDSHHVRQWAHGGETTLSNLVLLCRRRHRAVHREGFTVRLGPDGAAEFRWPDERALPAAPRAGEWTGPAPGPAASRADSQTASGAGGGVGLRDPGAQRFQLVRRARGLHALEETALLPVDVRLEQVAERGQAILQTGNGIGLEAAHHGAHGLVVSQQRRNLTVAAGQPLAGGRKDVRLLDLEVRAQVGLEEFDEPRHLLRAIGRPVRARVGGAAQDQPLRHDEAEVVVARQGNEARVALHLRDQ